VAINFDVVFCLCDIDTIADVDEPLSFEWNGEFVIDKVKKDVGCSFTTGSNSKNVDLSQEDYPFAINIS
jgi:hypothetical protein